MDQTHVHLLINHLPVIGSALGGFVLAYGIWDKNTSTQLAAYYVLIIASLGAVVTYLTGEAAEETVENIQGISKDMIEQHEDSAVIAFGALIVLGVASFIGLITSLKNYPIKSTLTWSVLFITIISFVLIARTGYLGGQIRHTEINSGATVSEQNSHEDH